MIYPSNTSDYSRDNKTKSGKNGTVRAHNYSGKTILNGLIFFSASTNFIKVH